MRIGLVAISMALAVSLGVPGARAQADCANWKIWDFFKTASAADVRACLRAGADPGAQSNDRWTPLHRAAWNGQAAAMAALLEGGADPGARTEDGYTPLHFAALKGHAAAIAALLNGGADPGARTELGLTSFDLIPGDSSLVGTAAYWRLHDAR